VKASEAKGGTAGGKTASRSSAAQLRRTGPDTSEKECTDAGKVAGRGTGGRGAGGRGTGGRGAGGRGAGGSSVENDKAYSDEKDEDD